MCVYPGRRCLECSSRRSPLAIAQLDVFCKLQPLCNRRLTRSTSQTPVRANWRRETVFVIGYKQSGRVTAIDRWDTEGYVRIRVDTGGELDIKTSSTNYTRVGHRQRMGDLHLAPGSTAINGTSSDFHVEVVIETGLLAVTCNGGLAPVHFGLDAVNLTFS